MPITLNCPCGKTLRVADEHAAKRVKCPVCNAVIAPPAPEPSFEVVEESLPRAMAAARLKPAPREEDEDDDGYNMEAATRNPAPPKKKPNFRKRADSDDEDDPDDNPRPRRRPSGAPVGKRFKHMAGGIAMLIGGVVMALVGNYLNGRGAIKLLIIGILLALAGLFTLVQGLTGNIHEDD